MASVTVRRSDLFGVGATVSLYPGSSGRGSRVSAVPGAAITTAVVQADGSLTFSDAAIQPDTAYVAAVAGQVGELRVMSSSAKTGKAVGTGDTTSGSAVVANAVATSGALVVGQRLTGPGIPAGTYILSISGASLTLSDKATATATGVALEGHGGTRWRAQVMARRAAVGTA